MTCLLCMGCYNFRGITIAPEIKTYYVEDFSATVLDLPGDLNYLFAEELRRKVREESKLVYSETDPHIVFSGALTKYNISAIAPDGNSTTSLNRLDIGIKVTYVNELNEEDTWTKSYSDFEDFDSNANFQEIEEGLYDVIIEDILERVFNDAFTDW